LSRPCESRAPGTGVARILVECGVEYSLVRLVERLPDAAGSRMRGEYERGEVVYARGELLYARGVVARGWYVYDRTREPE
jgi:hypothetical protein